MWNKQIAAVWVGVWMVSVNVMANINGPAIDGDIAVWAAGGVVYWQDLRGGQPPGAVPSYTTAAAPAISGRTIVFEYGSSQDVGGFNIDDPGWPFPAAVNNTAKQRYPEISGSRVVWVEYTDTTDRDIMMIDLDTSAVTTVCGQADRQSSPAMDGDIVVWQDNRSGVVQIYRCDVSIEPYDPQPVSASGCEQSAPDVSGRFIVWAENRTEPAGQDDTGVDIYGYDLTSGQEWTICADAGEQSQPAVCGSLIAWQDNAGGDYDIRVYDRQSGQTQTIAGGSGDQCYPALSGRTVVWQIGLTGTTIGTAVVPEPTDITLTAPEPNAMVPAGAEMLIDWVIEGPIEQVRIDYSTDGGDTWINAEPNVPADMPWAWPCPETIDSTDCVIRVSEFENGEVWDELDGTFTIFPCDETLTADVTGDCFVDLDDVAELAAQWLTGGNPYDPAWRGNEP